MKNCLKIFYLGWLTWLFAAGVSCAATIAGFEYDHDGRQLRIVFNESPPKHRLFLLSNPTRLVVDLTGTDLAGELAQPPASHPVIAKLRAATRNHQDLRLVVDLQPALAAQAIAYAATSGDRQLRISLSAPTRDASAATGAVVVALDAGHGGSDPGAQGVNGTQEKAVTLAIAKKLAALLNRQPGIKAVLVRDDDSFIALRQRMDIARKAHADLFVSIHADAYQDNSVRGASVYTLSKNGASSEAARWLAEKENSADLLGGVSLNGQDDDLASVLLDLSQDDTLERSFMVASEVLKSFQGVCQLHKDSVQKAGFIVLKSPDMPSILVETAFISNPAEEQNLLAEPYQNKIAAAIFKGVVNYVKQIAPKDSRIAGL